MWGQHFGTEQFSIEESGFEPPAPCSQGRCADHTALLLDKNLRATVAALRNSFAVVLLPVVTERADTSNIRRASLSVK